MKFLEIDSIKYIEGEDGSFDIEPKKKLKWLFCTTKKAFEISS
jgi:hypothetical protein